MGNVLSKEKREQVIALGQLGWSLRRIEADDGSAPRDGGRLSSRIALRIPLRRPGRRAWGRTALSSKAAIDDHRLWGARNSKPAIRGDHRLFGSKTALRSRRAPASLPRTDRAGTGTGPKRDGHLAGSGGYSRVRGRLSEREAICAQVARSRDAGSAGDHRDSSPAKSARSTTGLGRWCAIPTAANIAARGCSC